MLRRWMATPDDPTGLVIRLALGIVIFPHGAQKLLGWFGGHGFSGTMQFFQQMGIPAFLFILVIAAEFFGGLGLIVGFLSRVAAFGVACVMAVAILLVHGKQGFFMNWDGSKGTEGFEYHLLAIGLAIAVMIKGSGSLSVDRALTANAPGI